MSYPVVLLALLSVIVMTGSLNSTGFAYSVTMGILGLLATLAMIAFPVLLGFAVKSRRRPLWIAAILTGVVTVGMTIYLLVAWFMPLG